MPLVAFVVIVLLTWVLISMNAVSVVKQYDKDRNTVRLYSYLFTLLVMGTTIIGVSSAVVQRVIDAEAYLKSDTDNVSVHHARNSG
jgi:hypothetical protein